MKTQSQQEELLNRKLKSYQDQIKPKLNASTAQTIAYWYTKQVLHRNIIGVPRQSQFDIALKLLSPHPQKTKTLFSQDSLVNNLLDESEQLFDLAFILEQQAQAKDLKEIQSNHCLAKAEKRLIDILKDSSNPQTLLYIDSLKLYINLYQSNCKVSNPNNFTHLSFQIQRLQSVKIYEFLLKPLFQKKNLQVLYPHLVGLVNWFILMKSTRLDLFYDLSKKLNYFVISNKKSQEMREASIAIFDLLSVKFPRQSALSHLNLGALLLKLNNQLAHLLPNWLESRVDLIDSLDYQQLLKNLSNLGATNLLLQVLTNIWIFMKRNKKYNILLRLFSTYIRQDYLKISLNSSEEIQQYFKIILAFMIGFSNRQRFEGEEIDELTNKICETVHQKRLTLGSAASTIINVYATYQNRFPCLSELSKRFFNEIQTLYNIRLEIAQIHKLYDEMTIREIQVEDRNSEWQSQRKTSNRYRGLENLGNTCYINAFIQALYMTKKFRALVQSLSQQDIPSQQQTTIYALQYLFEQLTRKQFQQQQPLRPDYFRSELPEPYKSTPVQQDSGQFGRIYLQQLQKQLKGQNHQKLQKLLVQKLIKTIRCLKCNNHKTKQQRVFDLIMNVERKDNSIFLSKLIQKYFQTETFTNQDKIYCEHCNTRNDAISELHPLKLSDILVLTLSLFQYKGEGKKILLPLTFQFVLNVGTVLNNSDLGEYELYAFIVHLGSLPSSGHYVCYSRNLQQNPMIWYCFDDGYVTECEISKPEEFNFGQNESPYMLFYSKKNTAVSRSLLKH